MYNFADSGEAMTALIPIFRADFVSEVDRKPSGTTPFFGQFASAFG